MVYVHCFWILVQYMNNIWIGIIFVLIYMIFKLQLWLSWQWWYGSWIYNYLCNQCLSPLLLWVWISIRARCTTLCDKVCQWLGTGQWFSQGPPVSSTNKTYRHDITEILLKVALNTMKQTNHTRWQPLLKTEISLNELLYFMYMYNEY